MPRWEAVYGVAAALEFEASERDVEELNRYLSAGYPERWVRVGANWFNPQGMMLLRSAGPVRSGPPAPPAEKAAPPPALRILPAATEMQVPPQTYLEVAQPFGSTSKNRMAAQVAEYGFRLEDFAVVMIPKATVAEWQAANSRAAADLPTEDEAAALDAAQ